MTPAIQHSILLPQFRNNLIDRLPKTRGKLAPNAPLGAMTWFGVGGPAEVLFRPEDRADLAAFIKECPRDIPVTVIGVASNLIIRDGGIPGVVVRLGRDFAAISSDNSDFTVRAGAASMDMNVALASADAGIGGLEFLSGIPGSIGGALRMNAGAYGREIKDVLISCDILTRDGDIQTLTPNDMQMTYRHNNLPADVLFLSALLQGEKAETADIHAKMGEIKTKRAESQPIRTKTGGSTFANPDGMKAWELIDKSGCRGLKIGGAQVSEMHCNFLINTGNASAADIERLGEEVRKRVYDTAGVMLRWEIKRIGIPLAADTDIYKFMEQPHG